MVIGAISTVWVVVAAALLVFLLLVVLRFALTMLQQVKELAGNVREASERIQDALAEVRAETELASQRVEHLGELEPGRRAGRGSSSRRGR